MTMSHFFNCSPVGDGGRRLRESSREEPRRDIYLFFLVRFVGGDFWVILKGLGDELFLIWFC